MRISLTHFDVDLTGTAQQVLEENPLRQWATLQNDSDSIAYIQLGQLAELNKGIRLNAAGGALQIDINAPWWGKVYAISTGVTKRLMVIEASTGD